MRFTFILKQWVLSQNHLQKCLESLCVLQQISPVLSFFVCLEVRTYEQMIFFCSCWLFFTYYTHIWCFIFHFFIILSFFLENVASCLHFNILKSLFFHCHKHILLLLHILWKICLFNRVKMFSSPACRPDQHPWEINVVCWFCWQEH